SDKSRICRDGSDRRLLVWRSRGEQFRDCCIQEQDRWGGASNMVWGGISYNSKTPLLAIEGDLTARRYPAEVLEPTAISFPQGHPKIRFFQQDYARHSARVIRDFLEDSEVTELSWTVYLPDSSLIEHLWDLLK
ncbi:hypothetical protein CAPTEDRAFT_26497, partial [Capitella teleta]